MLLFFYLQPIYVCYNFITTGPTNPICRIVEVREEFGKLSQIDNQAFQGQDFQAKQQQWPWLQIFV
jgi:hypothetical protein